MRLLVVAEGLSATHTLPARRELVIGRSDRCDIQIDHPSVSRQHVVLSLTPSPSLRDLGSRNGTRVRDVRVEPGRPVEVHFGDILQLGSVTVFLQRGSATADARPPSIAPVDAPRPSAPEPIRVERGPMADVYRTIDRVAQTDLSVLLVGETGVGKEVVAETLHRRSRRRARRFLPINCAALSPSLFESELFGHDRGAFTGAAKAKPGLLETAQGGTVFLDEVTEIPLSAQVKLLRVLETRQITRVGGVTPRQLDVRFVSATNRHVAQSVADGQFREDLYFRINAVELVIPPLRERREEIVALAEAFISRACREAGRATEPTLSSAALEWLREYRWPGNVRELRNVISRSVALCSGEEIGTEFFRRLDEPTGPFRVSRPVQSDERARVIDALERCAWNQTRAAKLLGVSRRTLVNRLEAFDIPRPQKRRKR